MEPVKKLIMNFEKQIDKMQKIGETVIESRENNKIDDIINGMRQSQHLIESIKIINLERKDIENEIVDLYNLSEFDIVKLSLNLEHNQSIELMESLFELKEITSIIMDNRVKDIHLLKLNLEHMKKKYGETQKGQQAYSGYRKRNYESMFINKVYD